MLRKDTDCDKLFIDVSPKDADITEFYFIMPYSFMRES